jgi:predicted ATPase/DNA-binding CsgD family transcriptional regulator
LADAYDGVAFVPLALLRDPALIVPTLAQMLDVRARTNRSLVSALQALLRNWSLLMVLDNFEHLLPGAVDVVELLRACPRLSALVTSRAPLRVTGEHLFPVTPLPLPAAGATLTVAEAASSDAVALFVQRAQAIRPDFLLTEANVQAVAQICWQLEGLPLALELAAARMRIFEPAALLPRLNRRLPLLTDGPQDLPERLRTMRDAITWSYDLLSDDLKHLFRRLSVFAGGCTMEAAAAIASHQSGIRSPGTGEHDASRDYHLLPPSVAIVNGLTTLADHHLLTTTYQLDGEPRFSMLETIREFAQEQLLASEEMSAAHEAHADYFVALAEQAETELVGPHQPDWLDQLEEDLPNLRAALDFLYEHGDSERGLRLATALWHFWVIHDRVPEGRRWLEGLLALPASTVAPLVRARALAALGDLAERQGAYDVARQWCQDALRLAREHDDALTTAAALRGLANIATAAGDYEHAQAWLLESLSLAQQHGNTWAAALAILRLGRQPDADLQATRFEEALRLFRQIGDPRYILVTLADLGWCRLWQHEREDEARALVAEALELAKRLGYRWWIAWCLMCLAILHSRNGEIERAARFFGAAAALREAVQEPLEPSVQRVHDERVAAVRAALGAEAFGAAWAAGQRLTLDQMFTEARAAFFQPITAESAPAHPEWPAASMLTPREREVARLIARGRSNKEIAAELDISPHTAGNHVANIIAKLGVESRAAVAAFAVRHGLA